MNKTRTYTYFGIASNGEIGEKGLVAFERGIFNPEDITKALGVHPFCYWKKGDIGKNGTEYLFSSWNAEKSDIGRLDVEAQCRETIKNLKNKISILKQIKEQYDVNYVIIIVSDIYGEEEPSMSFSKEIVDFCYLTGTTIQVDMRLFSS